MTIVNCPKCQQNVILINNQCPGCKIDFNDTVQMEAYEISWEKIHSLSKPLKSKKQLKKTLKPLLIDYPMEVVSKIENDLSESIVKKKSGRLRK